MQKKPEHKREHHYVPKLYLRGFVEAEAGPFVWVYSRGKAYYPGPKARHNPRKRPISRVAVEKDHYAFKKRDGTIDFDTYEDELEKLEKPSNPVFEKLRRHNMITGPEKRIFASYINLMYKRIPKRKERLAASWPRILQSISSSVTAWLDSQETKRERTDACSGGRISDLRSKLDRELEYYRAQKPFDNQAHLKGLVTESQLGLPDILCSMTWQFFLATKGHGFLASDNPVFSPGIRNPYAEVSFPISKDIALVMSWYEIEEGFLHATPELVNEVNRRTASGAQREVYYSRAEKWVHDMLGNNRKGYYLIYSYPGTLA